MERVRVLEINVRRSRARALMLGLLLCLLPSEEGFRTAVEILSQEVSKAREIDLRRVLDRSFVQKIETGGLMQRLYR